MSVSEIGSAVKDVSFSLLQDAFRDKLECLDGTIILKSHINEQEMPADGEDFLPHDVSVEYDLSEEFKRLKAEKRRLHYEIKTSTRKLEDMEQVCESLKRRKWEVAKKAEKMKKRLRRKTNSARNCPITEKMTENILKALMGFIGLLIMVVFLALTS
ncbi:hypothetical protein BSKO_12124 [Bryopsis sp. KO-2023]|nr:hypothetical protein BSKO_12124 [Bryopsis sp. KO-2023]